MAGRPRIGRGTGGDEHSSAHGGSVQALDRGLTLLSIISEADGLSLTTIAQRAGIASSTAHRILNTLKSSGFIQYDEARGGYLIGVQAFRIGSAFLRNRKLADVGRGIIRRLMETSGETSSIGFEVEDHVVFIAQMESHNSIRAFHRPGVRTHMHASSLGKAMLAALPDEAVSQKLHRTGMQRFTGKTIIDPKKLLADLALSRKRGWTIDDEERAEGMRCVGAAIYNEFAEVMGAVSLSGPAVRMTDERLGELGPMIKRAAAEITEGIGGITPKIS